MNYDIESAKTDILTYLGSCGTRWYQARHTDRETVCANEPLIGRLAAEHIRNMELTKMAPAASAKAVCDEDMTTLPEF